MRRGASLSLATAVRVLALGLVLAGCGPARADPATGNATALTAFYAAEWKYELEHHPETATYVGDARFNDRLSDYSPAAQRAEARHAGRALEQLRALPATGLNEQDAISRDIMLRQLESRRSSFLLKEWEMPLDQVNGIHLGLAALHAAMPFNDSHDYRNYIARLRAIPRVLGEVTAVLELGLRDHLVQPKYLLEAMAAQVVDIASKPAADSPFALPFERFPAGVSAADQATLRDEGLGVIDSQVAPAYARFAVFLRTREAPAGRADPGIWALPRGQELYANAIREHVQTPMDADAIFAEGMREVASIRAQMLDLARAQGYADLDSFNAAIESNSRLHGSSAAQLLDLYRHYKDQAWSKLGEVVPVPPTAPLEVVAMDGFRSADAVPADYSPGSTVGGRPGRINVNLYHPPQRLLLNVEAIAYHEGVPGHHLQFAYADALKDLPAFRTVASFDAYSEGWALYAEGIAKELGFYQDPYSEYGRLQNEMWRAIRLVVDTGVHHKRWSRQQMVDMFKQNTAMDDQNIQTEVDRYIAWPAQALSYRLGQQKILELRQRARARLGARYDIRTFHARVLSLGPVPLDILDSSITRWIDAGGPP